MHLRRGSLVLGLVLAATVAVVGSVLASPPPAARARVGSGRSQVSAAAEARRRPAKRSVMIVGNNWAGTATIVDAKTHKALKTINIVPDKDEELQYVKTPSESHPAGAAYYYAIQQAVGEGHDQYVDDAFTTRNGKYLAVSRPSLRDVV